MKDDLDHTATGLIGNRRSSLALALMVVVLLIVFVWQSLS
jgi:hypothetical protein